MSEGNFARGADGPTRNLLILHTPDHQEMADWEKIKAIIDARAPDIEVRIATNGLPNSTTRRWQARRPSLVFSPVYLAGYEPPRGTIYAGKTPGKLRELERLTAAGLAVPRWAELTPDAEFPAGEWGEFVITKPTRSMRGQGVRLVRSAEIGALRQTLTQDGGRRMIVQRYVDNRDAEGHQVEYRVTMVFGEPMLVFYRRATKARRPLAEIADDPNAPIITNRELGVTRDYIKDPELLDFGRRVAAALPEIPVLGLDLLRAREDGKLWLLETNLTGQVWHFSSKRMLENYTPEQRVVRYEQFNMIERLAEILIARTRAEAR